jgi:hypothetical protein
LLDQFDAEIEASDLPWLLTFCDPSDDSGTVVDLGEYLFDNHE